MPDNLPLPGVIDDGWLETLLGEPGSTPAADPGDAALRDLLAAMTAPTSEADLAGFGAAVHAFVAAEPNAARLPRPHRLGRARSRLARRLRALPVAALLAAGGVLTLGTVAAAAYTGSLPSGLQDLAHRTIGAPAADPGTPQHPSAPTGLPTAPVTPPTGARPDVTPGPTSSVPQARPTGSTDGTPAPRPTASPTHTGIPPAPTTAPTGEDGTEATAPPDDAHGLCTAYRSGGLPTHSGGYRDLVTMAGSLGVDTFCDDVLG